MKKIILSLAALTMVGSAFAQTDKEAEKAAKAAAKAAEKEAMALYDQGYKCYEQANAAMNDFNAYKQMEKNADKVAARKAEMDAKVLELSAKGDPILAKALATGLVPQKKLFDGWRARDLMISSLLNTELSKAAQHEPFDTALFCQTAIDISEACHYQLKYGNPKDEQHKLILKQVELKFPKIHVYHAYATQFNIERKDLKAACESFDFYKNYAERYPEVANDPDVQNPSVPYAQMAFNIYFTAYNQKAYDTMDRYRELALQYDDESSRNFVEQSSVQVQLQKGDTAAWVAAQMDVIRKNPLSETSEVSIQNLLVYYQKKGVAEMGKFADEVLAIAPESKIANYGKGFSLFAAQKYAEALPFYKKTVEIDPDYMDGNFQCGTCLYNIGNQNNMGINDKIDKKKYKNQAEVDKDLEAKVLVYFRQAEPYFLKVQELVPDKPDNWAHQLKIIYTALKNTAKAKEYAAYE